MENGVLELAEGILRPGRPADQITLSTRIPYDPEAVCPRWDQFLGEVFEGNLSLIEYVARAAGYSLTGLTREQAFFFCSGVGSNGKGILFTVLRSLLGDYAQNLPFQSLEIKQRASIPNDIARLANRRLVTAAETNQGAQLDEALIKTLTGEDVITARFMRAEYFDFTPVAKFWLATNHRPEIKDLSHGFWRRIQVVPFGRVFPEEELDRDLAQKLKRELPGILAWAVRGCLAWQERGLDPPEEVREATEDYHLEMDTVIRFIAERCIVGSEERAPAGQLHIAFAAWASDEGLPKEEVLSATKFGLSMKHRFTRGEGSGGRFYHGISIWA